MEGEESNSKRTHLDAPITLKESTVRTAFFGSPDNSAIIGCSRVQGWRIHQEDYLQSQRTGECEVVGVFDGHGGEEVARACADNITAAFARALEATGPDNFVPAFILCVQDLEEFSKVNYFGDGGVFVRPQSRSPAVEITAEVASIAAEAVDLEAVLSETCGTTLTACVVNADVIVSCNVGDSRAVLASGGLQFALTQDHKPDDPQERAHIEQRGGHIIHGRVYGALAMSRCIGDFKFKSDPNAAPYDQVVTSRPDVLVFCRHPQDEFILLASDGLWGCLTNEQACAFVRSRLREGPPDDNTVQRATEALLDHCIAKDSRDNIAVVLVVFPAAFHPLPPVHSSVSFVLAWTVEQVGAWLQANGFSDAVPVFESAGINGTALATLECLDEKNPPEPLSRLKLGTRKKFVKKLIQFRQGVGGWEPSDVKTWLAASGAEELIPFFQSKNINGAMLCRMTLAELQRICAEQLPDTVSPEVSALVDIYEQIVELVAGLSPYMVEACMESSKKSKTSSTKAKRVRASMNTQPDTADSVTPTDSETSSSQLTRSEPIPVAAHNQLDYASETLSDVGTPQSSMMSTVSTVLSDDDDDMCRSNHVLSSPHRSAPHVARFSQHEHGAIVSRLNTSEQEMGRDSFVEPDTVTSPHYPEVSAEVIQIALQRDSAASASTPTANGGATQHFPSNNTSPSVHQQHGEVQEIFAVEDIETEAKDDSPRKRDKPETPSSRHSGEWLQHLDDTGDKNADNTDTSSQHVSHETPDARESRNAHSPINRAASADEKASTGSSRAVHRDDVEPPSTGSNITPQTQCCTIM